MVGAGIIGVAIAFELQRRGKQVVLVDCNEPGRGASFGNMASIAVTEFMPASRPSVWAQMPKWLLDPQGPVRVRPSYLPKLTPWFLRFLEASRPSRVKELEAAGAVLCGRVYEDLLALLDAAGLSGELSQEGCLSLYADEQEFNADREHIEVLQRFGFAHEVVGGNAIRELEPAITTGIRRAVLLPAEPFGADPFRLVMALFDRYRALGGQFESGEMCWIRKGLTDSLVGAAFKDGRNFPVAQAVLCAGAYTGRLSKQLGEQIPLETERGYHTQIMAPGISMRHSIIWPARAFMVTPTAGGIRVGGTVEMAGLDALPDYRRAQVLVRHAKEALPDLQVKEPLNGWGTARRCRTPFRS